MRCNVSDLKSFLLLIKKEMKFIVQYTVDNETFLAKVDDTGSSPWKKLLKQRQ